MDTEILDITNEITLIIDNGGLEKQTGLNIKDSFMPLFVKAGELKRKADLILVNNESQKQEMKLAKEIRLGLKDIRCEADKTRKVLKEDSLKYGKVVQGVYNAIEYLTKKAEDHCEQQEKFAEIQQAKRIVQLRLDRLLEVQPYSEFIPVGIDLGKLDNDSYTKMLNGAKLSLQAKVETEKWLEEEKKAKELAEAAERERIRIENEQLKAEREAREKEIAKEREETEKVRKANEEKAKEERKKIEAKLKAEREAKQKLEQELKLKAEKETRELKEKQLAEKRAENAPDKVKLIAFAEMIESINYPDVKSADAQEILLHTRNSLTSVAILLRKQIKEME